MKLSVLLLALGVTLGAQSYLANVTLTIDSTAAGVGFTSSDIAAGGGHPQAVGRLDVEPEHLIKQDGAFVQDEHAAGR